MDHREEIRKYLSELLAQKGDKQPFADDASLLISGRLASVDAVEIVVFLEEKFVVNFSDEGWIIEKSRERVYNRPLDFQGWVRRNVRRIVRGT